MSTCNYTVDESGIALMIIDNPPMNALSAHVLEDIRKAVTNVLEDSYVRVIVFTGVGNAFSVWGPCYFLTLLLRSAKKHGEYIRIGSCTMRQATTLYRNF